MSLSRAGQQFVGGAILGGGFAPHNTAPTNEFDLHIPNKRVLNSNDRLHWRAKAEHTKYIRTLAFATAQNAGFVPMYIAQCTVFISFQDERRRDLHNYFPTIKASIDGFVSANVITDDDNEHLIGPDVRMGGKSQKNFTTFHFELREAA